jgi:hypothetical protein
MPTHTRKTYTPDERAKYKDDLHTLCCLVGVVGVLELLAEIANDFGDRAVHRTDYDQDFPQQNIAQWLEISAIIHGSYEELMRLLKLD